VLVGFELSCAVFVARRNKIVLCHTPFVANSFHS
jgi:hypothetical protein